MPSANVGIVRQSLEAFNSKGVDGLASFWHPDIDWRAIEGAPDDVGVFTGEQAMRRYLGEWLEMFDEARNEPEEFIEAGDQLVAVQHASGIGKRNRVPVDMRYAVVYTVRDAKIIRGREYATRAEALQAVGLAG
jgi:ketosteroid isomerase-like protein